jgi:hypothetical protein
MPLGNSELAGIAYYSGNPSSAPVVGFDVAKGTLVIDQTNGELYQKIAAQGTNTGGYVTVGSQMEKVTTALTTTASYVDIVGLTGFVLEAATTYKVSGSLPITAANGVAINLNFLSAATVGFYSIGTLLTTATHIGAAPASVTDAVIFTGTGATTYIAFEAIIITALATTMKVQSKYITGSGAIVALGGTVTVTKVL